MTARHEKIAVQEVRRLLHTGEKSVEAIKDQAQVIEFNRRRGDFDEWQTIKVSVGGCPIDGFDVALDQIAVSMDDCIVAYPLEHIIMKAYPPRTIPMFPDDER